MLQYFTDAVLRGPTIGCMLMCLAAALVGVIIFLRKESLIGESLSHAAYPGVIIGIMVASFFLIDEYEEVMLSFFILGGGFSYEYVGVISHQ